MMSLCPSFTLSTLVLALLVPNILATNLRTAQRIVVEPSRPQQRTGGIRETLWSMPHDRDQRRPVHPSSSNEWRGNLRNTIENNKPSSQCTLRRHYTLALF